MSTLTDRLKQKQVTESVTKGIPQTKGGSMFLACFEIANSIRKRLTTPLKVKRAKL